MSLLDLYEADATKAAQDLIDRPLPERPKSPKFNAWRATTAAPKGAAAGAAESAGFWADVLGAFGQVMAATDSRSGGMFSSATAAERKQQDEARTKLITQGPDYSSEAGDIFRNVARRYAPDPHTAHTAEQLVFQGARGLSKAIGYAVAAGPAPGAVMFGADEGMAAADELRQQGVDLATRTKAGLVTAAVQGASMLLPVAPAAAKGITPQTIAQGAGLVAAGGPGSFIAQQSAVREILQSAGYDEIGAQFDPFDPVGLAVSTLLPAAFGGFALRRAVKGASPPNLEASASPLSSEAAPPVRVEPETVDAARVALASEQAEASRLTRPDDLPARAAEDAAITRAEEQLSAGQRVDVGEVVAAPDRLRAAMDAMPIPRPGLEVFHGTKANVAIEELSNTLDLGPHFTTARETAELFANSEGTPGRVLQGVARFEKSLELPDLDGWFPTTVAEAIDTSRGAKPGADGQTPMQARVWEVMERARLTHLDAQPEAYQTLRSKFGGLTPEEEALKTRVGNEASDKGNAAGYELIRSELRAEGYDSIKYLNMNEGAPVDTFIALDMSKVRGRAEPPIPHGFDAATAAEAADTLQRAGLGNLRMVETVDDLPESIRAKIEGEGTDARGAYDPATDTTYLVRSNIADMDEAFMVGLHEAFHRGLRKTVGEEIAPVLQLIHDGNARVRQMADHYMAEKGIADRIDAVEEVLADMAARAELGDLKGWDQLLAVIKQAVVKWAEAAGVKVEVTDKMVTDLVAGMRRAGMQTPVAEFLQPNLTGADAITARIAEIEARNPDLLVQLDGMDAPMPLHELLISVRAEAEVDIANAPLLQMAAECAMSGA